MKAICLIVDPIAISADVGFTKGKLTSNGSTSDFRYFIDAPESGTL
jgi:hypothetical protein